MSSFHSLCTCKGCQVDHYTCLLKLTKALDFVYALYERAKRCKCKSLKQILSISFCKYGKREVSLESLNNSDVHD